MDNVHWTSTMYNTGRVDKVLTSKYISFVFLASRVSSVSTVVCMHTVCPHPLIVPKLSPFIRSAPAPRIFDSEYIFSAVIADLDTLQYEIYQKYPHT